jgi:hypothetical protein
MATSTNISIVNDGAGRGSGPISGGGTEAPNIAGKNLREGSYISLRPRTLTSRHLYNLRNQTWAIPRAPFDGGDTPTDVISQFVQKAGVFPSNADYTSPFIYPKTDSTSSKYIDRFNASDAVANANGNGLAPIGYFIIDALDRGADRIAAFSQLKSQYSGIGYDISELPQDITPGGPTIIAQYSGRIFYSGFPGETIDGDSSSPKMASYVLFSQLVTDATSIVACYQANDPTSKDESDLLDTDGGFIRIEGAFNINGLVNLGSALVVFAENGVWTISGGSDFGFTATNYKVTKITNSGCISQGSIVVVENAVMYWSRDGIYNLSTNQLGDFVSENVTKKTIQTLYNGIGRTLSGFCEGVYDSYEQKVKWIYNNRVDGTGKVVELCLDINLGAYFKHTISNARTENRFPLVVKGILTDPFTFSGGDETVTVGSEDVTVNSELVTIKTAFVQDSTKEVKYLVLTGRYPTVTFSFGTYKDLNHYDWKSFNGVGFDAKSYLLTGVISGGDFQRGKQIMSMTVHFNKTEDGFVDDGTGSGDLTLRNQSSCLLQTQFDWTNSINSNRWSRKMQVYRLRRYYLPANASDPYDNGYYVTETKNRIRGSGKVMSILFESEPGKHMELLGWSMTVAVNGNV